MKSRIILIVILLIILLILTGHNNTGLQRMVLDWINPIRIAYKEFTNEIKSKSETYIFQKQEIERLKEENRVLRKYLFDQTSYLKQLKTVYDVIPSLEKIPYRNVIMVDTISYVKLNKFDEILLNAPEGYQLKEGKIYGLIQKEHVGGVAKVEDGHLYGYLISNQKCSFGVSIGKERYSGVAFGKDHNSLEVKFIPKWANVKVGDQVETSGLDGIFFANVPVGVVKEVSIKESYKIATVEFFADTMHPNIFFLILDAEPYLTSYYDKDTVLEGEDYPFANQPPRREDRNLTSIPTTTQTKYIDFDPSVFEIPAEETAPKVITSVTAVEKPKPKPKPKVKPKPKPKPKPKIRKKPKKYRTKSKPKIRRKPKRREAKPPIPVEPPPPPKEHKEPNRHPSPFDILKV